MNIIGRTSLSGYLCALAGTATALAQAPGGGGFPAPPGMTFAEAAIPAGYSTLPATEVFQFVYETPNLGENGAAGTFFQNGGASLCFDVIQLPMFPAAQNVPDPVPVAGIGFPMATTAQTPVTFDALITFFDMFDLGAAMPPFYSTELGHVRFNGIQLPAQQPGRIGFFWFNNLQIIDDAGNPAVINVPRDRQFGYELRYLNPGTSTLFPGGTGLQGWARGGPLAPTTGSSIPQRYFDANFNGVLDPSTLANPIEQSGSLANRRDVYLKLIADIPAAPPPGFSEFGTVDCTVSPTLSQTTTLMPGAVNWFRVVIPGTGATVASDTFLDITVDSSASFADAAMGLYNADGNRISADDDDGNLLDPQLTFAHGRRNGQGDATQLDGNDGDLPPGNYFLAVAGFGTTFGASAFAVNAASSVEFGDVTVTITSNVGSAGNCALPDPVAPAVIADLGVLPEGITSVNFQPTFRQIAWWTFTTSYNVTAGEAGNFLDIDTLGSEGGDTANTFLVLYDAAGNAVGTNFDNDSGPGVNAQLSYRNGTSLPGAGDGLPYEGQNGGEVPAGTYFVGVFNAPGQVEPDGWQTRATGGSSFIMQVNLRTPAGCRADFNADGNVDPDDLSDYITCFFTNAAFPGSCAEADFNGDGSADPDDLSDYITLFFTVTGGGPCV